jgi:putative FmdB family regulatory protein
MPIYEYACPECNIAFDAIQKMSEDPLKKCQWCEQNTLIRIYSVPNVKVEKEPTNIGELAEFNTKRMSKDELCEKSELKKEKKRKGLEEMASRVGGKLLKKSDKLPWWRDGKTFGSKYSEKPIDTSKIKNIRKYVETGEK